MKGVVGVILAFIGSSFSGLDWFEIGASGLVAIGCVGELYLVFKKPPENEEQRKRFENKKHVFERVFVCMVALGVSMELMALPYSLNETAKLHTQILVLKTNLADLSGKTLELAHQYDLSTNALAEANARLAAIRPLKQRLVDWLNRLDPNILPSLKTGKTNFMELVPAHDLPELLMMAREPDAPQFFNSVPRFNSNWLVAGDPKGAGYRVQFELRAALAE